MAETSRLKRQARDHQVDRGAAAVEIALALPLLVLLIFGIFEFGRGYNAKVSLTHAAREAVREYTIHQVEADAIQVGVDAAAHLGGVSVTVLDICDGTFGDTARVQVQWDLDYVIPLFSSGTATITESAVMRCGG